MLVRRALHLVKANLNKQALYQFTQPSIQFEYKQYELSHQQIQLNPEIVGINSTEILDKSQVIVPNTIIYNDPLSDMIYEMRNKRHEVAKKKRRKRKFGAKTKPRYK